MSTSASKEARRSLCVPGIVVQEEPAVYLTAMPGRWLLTHSTPSWRKENPHEGFQRIVKTDRARAIARTVLENHRTFPNAITLATTAKSFGMKDHHLVVPETARFLVVDGQHRLWAQYHSRIEGRYPCVIHMSRNEQQMATLFLEINDNQRRVPSSLRWDLVRLVRPGDQSTALTVDVVNELATSKESPFYAVGIDMTGEDPSLTIKQGSLAPEIRKIIRKYRKQEEGTDFEAWTSLFIRFFVAIKSIDPDWGTIQSAFFKARVMRALLRVLADILGLDSMNALTTSKLRDYLRRIDVSTLSAEEVRKAQGSAGVQDLYRQMKQQILS